MIEHIQGRAVFRLSGATISVNYQPKAGITAVVGPNGVGKTFTASESLRYLLYGSRALRAKLDTYETLELAGLVTIRGQRYRILRTLKKAELAEVALGETLLAVGQEEVTRKVEELMGYGLEVFDLCNVSVQGETQSLGQLTAGKRKEKIDEVLRVTDVRAVEKALREEAAGLRREAQAMERTLPQLGDAPEKPVGYEFADTLTRKLDEARELRRRVLALTSQIVNVAVPAEPTTPRYTAEQVAEAETIEARRASLEEAVKAGPLHMPMDDAQIELAEQRYAWEAERDRRGLQPELPLAQVEAELASWNELVAIEKMPDLEVQCPKCDHEFRTRPELPGVPGHTQFELRQQQDRHKAWATPMSPEPDSTYSLSPSAAERERSDRRRWDTAREAEKALRVLPSADFSLSEARQSIANWQAYDSALESKARRDVDNAMIEHQLADMPVVPDTDELQQRMHEALRWEQDIDRYEDSVEKKEAIEQEIADLLTKADDYLAGNKELSEARAELKSFLAPALSREASELIVDMTNGKLGGLIVDEDMNITVDGLPIEALSGAGKTVANIALRIALTKVLTGSAFPVFIGDEMDGDLDAERREATIQAMVSLKQHLDQIILITHKDVDIADHVIDLGDTQ